MNIIVPLDFGGNEQKVKFKVASKVENSNIFWYLNGKYLGETNFSHEKFVRLDKGKQRFMIVDSIGNKKSIDFFVDKK